MKSKNFVEKHQKWKTRKASKLKKNRKKTKLKYVSVNEAKEILFAGRKQTVLRIIIKIIVYDKINYGDRATAVQLVKIENTAKITAIQLVNSEK